MGKSARIILTALLAISWVLHIFGKNYQHYILCEAFENQTLLKDEEIDSFAADMACSNMNGFGFLLGTCFRASQRVGKSLFIPRRCLGAYHTSEEESVLSQII